MFLVELDSPAFLWAEFYQAIGKLWHVQYRTMNLDLAGRNPGAQDLPVQGLEAPEGVEGAPMPILGWV